MTDLEMTRLCAEAMGYTAYKEKRREYELCVLVTQGAREPWLSRRHPDPERYTKVPLAEAQQIGFFGDGLPRPLHDDAQAMALVKRFGLHIICEGAFKQWHVCDSPEGANARNKNLNRAICECVARMQLAKKGTP